MRSEIPFMDKKKKITRKNTNKKKGDNVEIQSPKSRISSYDFAQNLLSRVNGLFDQRLSIQKPSIKGILLCISRRAKASMTVEAALALPLFLIFFLQLGSVMEMMRLYGRIETALWETGRELCLYGGVAKQIGEGLGVSSDEAGKSVLESVGNLALSYTYVKDRVENYIGTGYLDSAPIKGGKAGLQYVGSELLGEDDRMEIVVTYCARPKWTLDGFRPFLLENRYVGRLWTGYDLNKNKVYYLAENIEVYHCDRECTHLRLQAYQVKWEEMLTASNDYGKKYRACKKCIPAGELQYVWISPEGECYHAGRDCSGLKRTVHEVSWEEASKYSPCSRCANQGGTE